MDPHARTLRFDLNKVTKDQVLEFVKEKGDKMTKVILYEEVATVTSKLHLQGWALFGSKSEADNFSKNRLREFKKLYGLQNSETSCATVKKDSYFAYTAKDGKCVYSVGVTDEERIANEEKSFKKESRDTIPARVMAILKDKTPTRIDVAKEVLKIYRDEDRLLYGHTISATVNLIVLKIGGETVLDDMAARF